MSPTPELIAVPGVGIALAGLILKAQQGPGARMDGSGAELRGLRDRLSRLEGKMDFLEACIVGRNKPPALPDCRKAALRA